MRTTRAIYLRWADDPTGAEWLGTCPIWIASMRRTAEQNGRRLIETPIRLVRPKTNFCIECQKITTH